MSDIVKYIKTDSPLEGKFIKKDDAVDGRWLGIAWLSKDEITVKFELPPRFTKERIDG